MVQKEITEIINGNNKITSKGILDSISKKNIAMSYPKYN
tara:strand:+ start:389 stop:505 length:117 start_codon:yes stop_codon:yes gene_type:complete